MNAIALKDHAPAFQAYLKSKPIVLPLYCGKVAKSDIAKSLGVTPALYRYYLAPILDSNEELKTAYQAYAKKGLISPQLAEWIIREFYETQEVEFKYVNPLNPEK